MTNAYSDNHSTHHTILVSARNIISAVTDETWDKINHQHILKQQLKLLSSNDSIKFDGQ